MESRAASCPTIAAASNAGRSWPTGCESELSARIPLGEAPGEGTALAVAFRSLTEEDRELLALQGWEGLSAGEIATVLGCTGNAARIRLHRARRRLRAALAVAEIPADTSHSPGPAGPVDPLLMKGEVS